MSCIDTEIFLEQVADMRLINNVGSICAECYHEFEEGEHVFYDMESYRYLCQSCAKALSEELNANRKSEEEENERGESLFQF